MNDAMELGLVLAVLALIVVGTLWFFMEKFIIPAEEAQAAHINLCQSKGMWTEREWNSQYVGMNVGKCVDINGEVHEFKSKV